MATKKGDGLKIFIDIGHPAHVHYFKNLIRNLTSKGHQFVITARNKEMAHYLLKNEGLSYTSRGKGANAILSKVFYLARADWLLYRIARREQPDLFLSFASPYCAHAAKLLGKDHIAIDDTENATLGLTLYKPFSTHILTPDCYYKDLGEKQVRFPSYMELSYLHPNRFTPDDSIFELLKIKEGDKYVIARFVGWNAVHDVGHKGLSLGNKIKAIRTFSEKVKVFISSEKELPDELKENQLNIPKHRVHDALAFASMFYGESATMASEAAVLGVPAILLDNVGRGYTDEQEKKYGLVFNYSESFEHQIKSIEKGLEILADQNTKQWEEKRSKLLSDKIDLTEYLEEFILNYCR